MYACLCHAVTEGEVVAAVLDHGCDSVQAVGERTAAGTGCGSCHERLEGLLGACDRVCSLGAARERRSTVLAG